MNEISILRLINHKSIVKIFEVYESEDYIDIVMDLLEGEDLLKALLNETFFDEEQLRIIFYQLVDALSYIHRKGIMHRDIKPENIVFKKKMGVDIVLADFGLSEFSQRKEWIFKRCGTPGYVAPEILRDKPYTSKIDVFSLGIILYIL